MQRTASITMESIVDAVCQRLLQWQQGHITISGEANMEQWYDALLQHRTVHMIDVSTAQLLGTFDDALSQWLYTAMEYNNQVTLYTNAHPQCIDPAFLTRWPIIVRNRAGRRWYAFTASWITASDLRVCEPHSVVLLFPNQRITPLGKDIVSHRQLQCIERSGIYANG